MGTIQGKGKLYRQGEYVCDTRYWLTWEQEYAAADTFGSKQTVGGLTSAEGSLAPDERVFDVGDELHLELDNGARVTVIITESDLSDPLSALLVRVTGK